MLNPEAICFPLKNTVMLFCWVFLFVLFLFSNIFAYTSFQQSWFYVNTREDSTSEIPTSSKKGIYENGWENKERGLSLLSAYPLSLLPQAHVGTTKCSSLARNNGSRFHLMLPETSQFVGERKLMQITNCNTPPPPPPTNKM